jgi:hypothetical protein
MRSYFDAHPEKLFVVITPPPVHRLDSKSGNSARARSFASWMKSTAAGGFLEGSHSNVKCFDLFNYLAIADDGSATANMLKYDYEQYHDSDDSHPNDTANAYLAPILGQFLIDASLNY